jgi:nucleotide-binding universal stress UspA family protein
MAIALAGQLDCRILFVECTAPADLIKSRLAHREGKASVSDARLRHYELLNRRYIPADEIEPTRRVRVDTTRTIHDCIQALLSRHCAGALGEPVTSNKQRSRPFRKEDSMFKTILAATDHITTNDPSVEAAALLAAENNSRLVILHVLESASTKNRRWVKHFETGKNIHCDTAYETLVTLQLEITHEKAMRHAQTAKIRVATGYPWEEILRQARSAGADLIVMGPHSGRAIQKGVVRVAGRVGSTVQGVITREKCPVMIVNPRLARQIYRFSRILVGIDFSAACECALCFTGQLAKFYDAKVFAFHMIPVPPYPKYTSTDYAADRTAAGERLKYFCREYLAKTDWTYHIHPGALPHQELLGCAEKVEADLIVLGSHTRQSQGKWYPGSAVERVSYRSNCPVMVINDPEALQPWQKMRASVSGQSRSTDHRIHLYTGSSRVTP